MVYVAVATKYLSALRKISWWAIGSIVGPLLAGVFAVKSTGGRNSRTVTQPIGVLMVMAYAAVMMAAILFIVKIVTGLRISPEQQREGLDVKQHREQVP